jgi:tetratricopeptide (TPR) repeat protein
MRALAIALSLCFAIPAFADEPAADDMIARGHYARGAAAYDAGHYEEALHEFEDAHAAKPLPAFDYNIARCEDRLGHKTEAVVAYDRYLAVAGTAENAAEVRERVAILHHELAEIPAGAQLSEPVAAVTVSAKPRLRRWIVPGTVGGSALALGVIGAGLLGSAASSYRGLASSCSPRCSPGAWSGIPGREHAGEALLGVAAVGAAVDLALVILAVRQK